MTEKRNSMARALWYSAKETCEIRDQDLPQLATEQLRVRTINSAVSRGTEGLVFRGNVPESEWKRMRAPHQDGEFPFPVKYGYACVGQVETGPHHHIGEFVFGLFPHQTHFNASLNEMHILPDGVPAERAVLAANMETALNALWDGLPSPGDHICVVGGGVVGLLTAYLAARIPATKVTLVDVNDARAVLAETLGFDFAKPEGAPADQDLVFHTSAQAAGLETALKAAGDGATVVEMSWYGATSVSVPLGADFHARRLSLKSSQVGTIPVARQVRWNYRRRLGVALSLLRDPALDLLISHRIPFEEAPHRLPEILTGQLDALAPVLVYS
ncbi:dehydrogenase [Roseibium polysiphoniae]|uniref:Dehydrogenase n=2 Tax=Roseibium polysiphoniae TaxID=2571221 RepID=A0A944GU12_9HYPH|nr:dehydrogenase [Roseibium polysiphoniae]